MTQGTENVAEFELPPPGAGLMTVTVSVPATEISSAPICAVTWLALTNVVNRLLPFHCSAAPDTKFEPFTVRVKAGPPRVELFGEIAAIVGTGLSSGGGGAELALPQPARNRELQRKSKNNRGFFIPARLAYSRATPCATNSALRVGVVMG